MARARNRPVCDRPEVEQHRAAVAEEVTRDTHPPAVRQFLQRVEEQERARRTDTELPDRIEQAARVCDLAAPPRVKNLHPRPPRLDLGGGARNEDVTSPAEVVVTPGNGVVEDPLGWEVAAPLPHPNDVVAPVQGVEGGV